MKSSLPSMFYYGFPIVLPTTAGKGGNTNVTPISYNFTLGTDAAIVLIKLNKVCHNVTEVPEVVFNPPSAEIWEKVEVITPYIAQNPVPLQKVGKHVYTDGKSAIGGFTQLPSEKVHVPRITECPIQAEAIVKQVNDRDTYALVELEFIQIHTEDHLVTEEDRIGPLAWEPLIYNFKHYYGLGEHKRLNSTIR